MDFPSSSELDFFPSLARSRKTASYYVYHRATVVSQVTFIVCAWLCLAELFYYVLLADACV